MAVQEDLAVQYHQQDTNYYCGAACAQMVLAQIGAGLLDQDDLYADNHSHSTTEPNWYTGPDGLTWTLNDRRPAGFTNSFVLFALANEELISRKICWTIHHYQATTRWPRSRWCSARPTGSLSAATTQVTPPPASTTSPTP